VLQFVRNAFRNLLEVVLWVNLIVFAIGGGYLGKIVDSESSYSDETPYVFLGILLGVVVGMLLNIIVGGLIATVVEIGENVKILKDKSLGKVNVNEENIKKEMKKCPYCANDIKKETVVCEFCGKNV
jgi:hypothetical protein